MKVKLIIYLICMILSINLIFGVTSQVSSFYGQTNPFNITFTGKQNQSYTLAIPQYGYVQNVNLNLKTYFYWGNFSNMISSYLINSTTGVFDYIDPNISKLNDGIPTTGYHMSEAGPGYTGFFTLKKSYPYYDFMNNITIVLQDRGDEGISGDWVNVSIYNYTSNSWKKVISDSTSSGSYSYCNLPSPTEYNYDYQLNLMTKKFSFNASEFGINKTNPLINLTLTAESIRGTTICDLGISYTNSTIANFYLTLNDILQYNSTSSLFNNINVSLNTTLANQLLSSGSQLNVTYHSDTAGILEVNLTNATYSYGLDSCTASYGIPSNASVLNVTFVDANNNPTSTMHQSYFGYGISNNSESYYSFNATQTSFKMCIYPSWAAVYSNYIIYYNNMTYYANNILNGSNPLYLPLFVQTGTYPVTFTVQDYDDNEIADATIQILRWDVSTNSYTTTESILTDLNGQAIGQLELGTAFYKFIIKYNGITYLTYPETQGIRQYTQTRTFRIDLGNTEWFDNYLDILKVYNDVFFNNATATFNFIWSDSTNTVEEGCLRIVKRNQTGDTVLSDSCVASVAANIIYTITPENFTTYIGTGYFNYNGEIYVGDIETVNYGGDMALKDDTHFEVLISLVIILALTLLGVEHPVLSYAGFALGLIASFILQWWVMSAGAIFGILLSAAIHLRRFQGK